jgi:hypothetical protein
MADPTYQPTVYKRQGGRVFVAASGGAILMETGSNFYCVTESSGVSPESAKMVLYDFNKVQQHVAASASVAAGTLVPSVIYNHYKYHLITTGSNNVSAYLYLASAPSVGMEMYIFIDTPAASANNLGQSTNVVISCDAGCIVPLLTLVSQSRAILKASSNSCARIHMTCIKDGEWSIVSVNTATAVTHS